MVKFLGCTLDDIITDAIKNDHVKELKKIAATKGSKGGKISFIELKRAYYLKFYKEMVPVAEPKAPSMWELIDAL